jgi:C4-dicarboxylate-specific signal transduction histidine kinase
MEDLSLHILDIAENAIRAKARNVGIRVIQNDDDDTLIVEVTDDGEGMNEEAVKRSIDPFFTTKAGKNVGLGLPFLAQSVQEAEGTLNVESAAGGGTKVTAVFRLSHIDRKPLGNLDETVRCLKATHPEVNFVVECQMPDQ